MKRFAIALATLLASALPVKADLITDTFTGVVVLFDPGQSFTVTTNDLYNDFGGGSLIGKPFTMSFSIDSSLGSGLTA